MRGANERRLVYHGRTLMPFRDRRNRESWEEVDLYFDADRPGDFYMGYGGRIDQ